MFAIMVCGMPACGGHENMTVGVVVLYCTGGGGGGGGREVNERGG